MCSSVDGITSKIEPTQWNGKLWRNVREHHPLTNNIKQLCSAWSCHLNCLSTNRDAFCMMLWQINGEDILSIWCCCNHLQKCEWNQRVVLASRSSGVEQLFEYGAISWSLLQCSWCVLFGPARLAKREIRTTSADSVSNHRAILCGFLSPTSYVFFHWRRNNEHRADMRT